MTARALELIALADVIVYDRLIPDGRARRRPPGRRADLTSARRAAGSPSPQAEIEELLLERGAAGRTVVRLKGGDPFVFGRGGEEALGAAEPPAIAFEVVPGVTAGVAAPAYAGIPVTHRGRRQRGRVRHRPRGPGQARERRSTGRRWRRSRGRSSSTWASPAAAQIAARPDRRRARRASEPAAVVRARARCPTSARCGRRSATIAEAVAERGRARAGDHRRGRRSAALAEQLAWLAAAAAGRTHRRGHPRARPGQRPGAPPAGARRARWSRRRRSGSCRSTGPPRSSRRLRPRLPDEPERGAAAVRAARRGRPRRPRAGRREGRGDRPGDGRGAARARDRADVVPERFVAEGLVEALEPTCRSRGR